MHQAHWLAVTRRAVTAVPASLPVRLVIPILGKAQWRSDGIDTNGRGVQDPNKTSNDKSGVDKADSPNDSDKYYQEGDAGVDGRRDVIPISTLHGKNPQHIRTSSEVLTFVRRMQQKQKIENL